VRNETAQKVAGAVLVVAARMTQYQFRIALDRIGLSQVGAARLFGGDERTFRRYALGEARVPAAVVILLRLLELGKITGDDIADARRRKP
jgi:hypothetical protein